MLHKAEEWKVIGHAPKIKMMKEHGRHLRLDDVAERKVTMGGLACNWRLALRGIDSLLVQAHRLPVAIDTGEFGGCERVATARFRAVLRPTKELAERVGFDRRLILKDFGSSRNQTTPIWHMPLRKIKA